MAATNDLPVWELAGAALPAEPNSGGLDYLAAVTKWSRDAPFWQQIAARMALSEAKVARGAAHRALMKAGGTTAADLDPAIFAAWEKADSEYDRVEDACIAANRAVLDDFNARWLAGEFIAFGTDPRNNSRGLISTSWRDEINFAEGCPVAWTIHGFAFQRVRFYRSGEESRQQSAKTAPGKRGLRPVITDRIEAAMRAKYGADPHALLMVTQEALATEFGVSRKTAKAARDRILPPLC